MSDKKRPENGRLCHPREVAISVAKQLQGELFPTKYLWDLDIVRDKGVNNGLVKDRSTDFVLSNGGPRWEPTKLR